MFEITISTFIVALSVIFTVFSFSMLRIVRKQTTIISKFYGVVRDLQLRVLDLADGQRQTVERVVDSEFRRMDNMNQLLKTLRVVMRKQNELILKAAGFNRDEVAELIEKQTNEGVYALLEELGTVQSLRADAQNSKRQGEREEISAGPPDADRRNEIHET